MSFKYITIYIVVSSGLQGVELGRYGLSITPSNNYGLNRSKRASCGDWRNEFRCRDGTCITKDRRCDGAIDCPDRSDETHYLCKDNRCPDYLFRCIYGACVDGTAVCNGVAECADNSDELQPRCLNDTRVIGSKFKCDDGNLIELYMLCDGVVHCKDGSDETLRSCAGNICPTNLFQCAYGACIDEGADCNDIDECADGSDESDILCNRKVPRTTTTTTTTTPAPTSTPKEVPNKCILPSHPLNGIFLKSGESAIYTPGQELDKVYLNVTCKPGYKVVGDVNIFCFNGYWSSTSFPGCRRACKLPEQISVVYRCLILNDGSETTRECEELEFDGTVVTPECNTPNYYSPTVLPNMFCVDGNWSHSPKCLPECGTLTPKAEPLVVGGNLADRGEIPWHAGVYKKVNDSYSQICGASLISESVLISAAHCFWLDGYGQLPEHNFAIAVGKVRRKWNHVYDSGYAQKSKVQKLVLAQRFYGANLNFQRDLAIIVVEQAFQFRPYIRPVCLDFSHIYYDTSTKLENRTLGKVAGWGLTTGRQGSESSVLKVVNMPFVPFDECVQRTPNYYIEFIAGDKFCAGFANGTTVCKGDSGGGWTYPLTVQGTERYFLGGVVSTSPPSIEGLQCNLFTLTSFTDIFTHVQLIREYWMP